MSAVDNASKYFKKAKGVPHTIRLLTQKIEQAEGVLKELEIKYGLLVQSKEWKDLKPLFKVISKNENEAELPYRKFNEQGFEILVGKNHAFDARPAACDVNSAGLRSGNAGGRRRAVCCGVAGVTPDVVAANERRISPRRLGGHTAGSVTRVSSAHCRSSGSVQVPTLDASWLNRYGVAASSGANARAAGRQVIIGANNFAVGAGGGCLRLFGLRRWPAGCPLQYVPFRPKVHSEP